MTPQDLLTLQDDLDYLLNCYRSVEALSFSPEFDCEGDDSKRHVGRMLVLCNDILQKLLEEFNNKRMEEANSNRITESG